MTGHTLRVVLADDERPARSFLAALLRSFQPCLTLPSNEVIGTTYVLYRPSCAAAGKTHGIR